MYSRRRVFTGHGAAIYKLGYIAKQHRFFSCSGDGTICSWNPYEALMEGAILKSNKPLYAFHLNENYLVAGSYAGILHVADLEQGKEIKALQAHHGPVFSLLYEPMHKLWLSGGGDGLICVFSDRFELIRKISVGQGKVRSIRVNREASSILVACGDGRVQRFTLPGFELLQQKAANELSCNSVLFYQSDENIFLSGGRDAHLMMHAWDKPEAIKKIPAHNYAIYDMLSAPEANILITASRDKSIKVWNLNDLSFRMKLDESAGGHKRSVNTLAWIEPGRSFISGGDDREIILWSLDVGAAS